MGYFVGCVCKRRREGGDPLADRRKSVKSVPTFREAATIVHAEYSKTWRNKKHAAQWIRTLETFAYPHVGNVPIDEIGTAETLAVLSPIWLKRPETARRVRQRIGTVFDWAKAYGHRTDENPIRSVSKGLPQQPRTERHHAALPYAELPDFLVELRDCNSGSSAALALEFLILTATRTNEVLRATWKEIDINEGLWTISEERMKAKREFRVPLSMRAIEVLHEASKSTDANGYVFSGRRDREPLSQMALLMLLKRMNKSFTTHGFRSTFRDWAAERTNFSREICESALAHVVKDKTAAAYLRTDQFAKRRKLMDAGATFAQTTSKAKVLKLGGGG
ncbi:MAG TPA: site-specific integrase [Woeseiaceae bacterium]|nr:site-specific integrase [Woeseiaceae bacterium]